MHERELSQLAVLADALVSSPKAYKKLVNIVRAEVPPASVLSGAIDTVEREFESEFSSTVEPDSRALVRKIADRMLHNANDTITRLVGRALAGAIENVKSN